MCIRDSNVTLLFIEKAEIPVECYIFGIISILGENYSSTGRNVVTTEFELQMTRQSEAPGSSKVAMLYDGGCPLCSREVAHYRRVDKHKKVHWADIQFDPEILHKHGISRQEAMKFLHAVDANGKIIRGVPAFRVIWAELPYYRILAKVSALPGVSFILDRLYTAFARKRYIKRMDCATGK